MNFKEFNKWTTDLYTPPQVNEDGSVSNDRVLKFNLSYGDTPEITNTPVLAITLAEALYRAIYNVLITSCPIETDINAATSDDDILSIKNKLISCLTFTGIKIKDITNESISFTRDNTVYTITSEDYDFSKIYDAKVEDDIIAIWEKHNDNDMICYICYNVTNLAINLKEINKLTNLQQINGMVKNNLFTHSNFLVCKFGFASITDEDVANNKYSNYFAKEVSYKRALIEKLDLDRKIVSEQLEAVKYDFGILESAIKRYYKMRKRMNKRIHDLRKFVNDEISSIYPDSE